MILRGSFALCLALASLGGTGCVSCLSPECHKIVHDAGPTCEVPRTCRDRVYTFVVSGMNPWGGDLDELQACMHRHGFAKVGRAGVLQSGWLVGEMKRIRCCDPEARFVLIGYDLGATTAVRTAVKATEKNLTVEAVVLLDPVAVSQPNCKSCRGVRTVLIRSVGGSVKVPDTEIVEVSDADHFNLCSRTTTMATVCGILEEVATAVWSDVPNHTKYPSWESDAGPTGRFSPPVAETEVTEWNFLHERVGGVTPPLTEEGLTVPPESEPKERPNPAP